MIINHFDLLYISATQTQIYYDDNYSISAGATKTLVNNYKELFQVSITGDMSAVATGSGGSTTQLISWSGANTIEYEKIKTQSCVIGRGQMVNLGQMPLLASYLRVTNDNSAGASWKGNIHLYVS